MISSVCGVILTPVKEKEEEMVEEGGCGEGGCEDVEMKKGKRKKVGEAAGAKSKKTKIEKRELEEDREEEEGEAMAVAEEEEETSRKELDKLLGRGTVYVLLYV